MSCEHENKIPTLRLVGINQTVALQCQQCGSGFAVKKSLYDLSNLPPFDETLRQRFWEERSREREKIEAEFQQKMAERSEEWWEQYNAYLGSREWLNVRSLVLNRDRVCQRCFVRGARHAHHLSYETYNKYGFTFPAECVGMCEDCHKSLHPEMV